MKIEKYIWCIPQANIKISKRLGINKLSNNEMQVLYVVRKIPRSTNASVLRYLEKMQLPAWDTSVSNNLKELTARGLLIKEGYIYSIAPLGRDWMYGVRQYLLNFRLR